jgi:hypothetical protein
MSACMHELKLKLPINRILKSIITLLALPKKKEEPGSAIGLKANDEVLISSKTLSLLLSVASEINVKHLLSIFETNGNFPVVGDGCACSATGSEAHFSMWQRNINKTQLVF